MILVGDGLVCLPIRQTVMSHQLLFDQKLLGASVFMPKDLIESVGRTPAALVQQLHHYLRGSKFEQGGKKWVCMTLKQWGEILRCHAKTVQRAFERLESLGLVIGERLHAHRYNQKKSYTLDYQQLESFLEPETKCPYQLRQTVSNEMDTLSISTNKNLKTNSRKQHTKAKRSKVHNGDSHQTHPVSRINKEKILIDTEVSEKGECISNSDEWHPQQEEASGLQPDAVTSTSSEGLDPKLEVEIIETIGHKISANLKQVAANASLEVVKDALTLIQASKTIKNKAGFFRRALEGKWKPAALPEQEQKFQLDPDYEEWWGYAKSLNKVMGSEVRDNELFIFAAPNAIPMPYQEMRQKHSLADLRSEAHPKTQTSAQSLDLSDVLAQIKIHYARLQWTASQVQTFLKDTYGKAHQDYLDNDQLFDLQARLQGLSVT